MTILSFALGGCATFSETTDPAGVSEREPFVEIAELEQVSLSDFSWSSETKTEFPEAQIDQVDSSSPKFDLSKAKTTRTTKRKPINVILPLTSIRMKSNPEVRKWVKFFSQDHPKRFQRHLNRGEHYRSMIEAVLAQHQLPKELYYLGLVESGYRLKARSHANAVGVWQFIRATGMRFGLKSNYYVDERKDVYRSSQAAAKYLKKLFEDFQDWELALASYNAGERRVMRATIRGKTRDFWELSKRKLLPQETRNYVPKFMAAVILGEGANYYGFQRNRVHDKDEKALVRIPSPIHLKSLSWLSSIPIKDLRALNPHILHSMTPPGEKEYAIWVPASKASKVISVRSKLQQLRVAGLQERKYEPTIAVKYHTVSKGDTLFSIAKKYRTSIDDLKKINRMSNHTIHVGRRIRVAVNH